MTESGTTVVAVIWTYNRLDVVTQCVRAVLDQQRPPDRVIVVDSASPDDTARRLPTMFPEIEVIALDDNGGPGAALAAAFDSVAASSLRPDYYWLVEDDSRPGPTCLAAALAAASTIDHLGILGPVGCTMRWGQWHATEPIVGDELRSVDFVVLDGALVTADAVRCCGHPRTDYFIMMVDVEYPLRMASHGFAMVQARLPYTQLRLGAGATDHRWRNYYQSRNHLRLALDHRSPTLLGGFVIRSTKHVLVAARRRDWVSIRQRAHGVLDALRGRMGRTVEPPMV